MSTPWKQYGRYGTVGIELVLSILVGYYAGHWADQRWAGGHGWITALGVLVGVYSGFRQLFRAGAQMLREAEREERMEREASERRKQVDEARQRFAQLDSSADPSQTGRREKHEDDEPNDRPDERGDDGRRA